jgi:hypothetical protein
LALCEFALGKLDRVMIVARLVSGGNGSTQNVESFQQEQKKANYWSFKIVVVI